MPRSAAAFPVTLVLPAANAGGTFYVNGDTARLQVDLRRAPALAAAPLVIELRARGFRGDARVGRSPAFTPPSAWLEVGATMNISSWVDRGQDGWTYTSWAETLREGTEFYFRVLPSTWRTTWTYADSTPFQFCEWPSIGATVAARSSSWAAPGAALNASAAAGWDAAAATALDPASATMAWRPYAASGGASQVQLYAFVVGDAVRVRAFAVKCMTGVTFTLETWDAAAAAGTHFATLCAYICSLKARYR
jgi:hypothetical protein